MTEPKREILQLNPEAAKIANIVKTAFELLKESNPSLVTAVLKNNYFITVLGVQLLDKTVKRSVVVDMQRKMTYDPNEFYTHSQKLANDFFKPSIQWYEV